MDAGGRKASCGVRRQYHVHSLWNSSRIEHRNERMNILELTGHDIEASRCVHPAVHERDKHSGEDTADRDDNARKKMKPSRYPVPTVQVDPKKNCLGKESEAFQ